MSTVRCKMRNNSLNSDLQEGKDEIDRKRRARLIVKRKDEKLRNGAPKSTSLLIRTRHQLMTEYQDSDFRHILVCRLGLFWQIVQDDLLVRGLCK
jgi:hypothetical protein